MSQEINKLFYCLFFFGLGGQEADSVESSAQLLAFRACEFIPWATANTVIIFSCLSYSIVFFIC